MQFYEWITKKYIQWRGDAVGRDRTVKDFADWIGVSNQLMSYWMRKDGIIPRHQKTINKLVSKYGPEVYDVLGIPRPLEFILLLEDFKPTYDTLSPERQEQFLHRIRDILDEYIASQ